MHDLVRPRLAALAIVALLLVAWPAHGLPLPGAALPALRLLDAWDRTLELSRLGAKPVLVVYEDKDSATQNQAFKNDLATLARGDRYRSSVGLVAIADVQGYDYWPVRGFVKDAIKDESHKFGTVIYCDWDGSAQRTLGLRRGTSNVILYGKDGKVLFSHEGAMSADERRQAIALLRAQVEAITQR
jgi:hypothetical protein